jgi:bifunctional NMN adenylyltransferase/nudix hydrolase
MKKYGMFLGRFQPFHVGHEAVVHEIIADGREPVLVIGSSNVINEKNPYTPQQRKDMIHCVFPEISVMTVPDCPDDEKWVQELKFIENYLDSNDITWYTTYKISDRSLYTYKNTIYTYYQHFLTAEGLSVTEATYPSKLGIKISATDIRKDIDEHRHYLDSRVYKYLKDTYNVKRAT